MFNLLGRNTNKASNSYEHTSKNNFLRCMKPFEWYKEKKPSHESHTYVDRKDHCVPIIGLRCVRRRKKK